MHRIEKLQKDIKGDRVTIQQAHQDHSSYYAEIAKRNFLESENFMMYPQEIIGKYIKANTPEKLALVFTYQDVFCNIEALINEEIVGFSVFKRTWK